MKTHRMSRWARLVTMAALVPTLAWAQGGPGERVATIDPVDPVDRGAGTDMFSWTVMQVNGLGSASTLGALWVHDEADAYVWTSRPVLKVRSGTQPGPIVITPEDPNVPPGGAPQVDVTYNSSLLRFDGTSWSPVLERKGETAGTLFANAPDDMYAATVTAGGAVRVWHFDGSHWRAEVLPPDVTGPVGDFGGDHYNVYLRAGDKILLGAGRHWSVAYKNPLLDPGHAIVYLARDQIIAPGLNGSAVWDGRHWKWSFPPVGWQTDVHGAWGDRDAAGELHMFVTGHGMHENGMCIEQLVEDAPGSLCGSYGECLAEPTADPMSGYGVETWGTGVHDVYMAGVFHDEGFIERFNGVAWTKIVPIPDMTQPTSVGGTREGDVWVALRDGRIVRGERKEPLVTDDPLPIDPFVSRLETAVRRDTPGSFVLEYGLPEGRNVNVGVYDVAGRRVAELENGYREAGTHQVRWNAGGALPGIYFYQVRAGALRNTGRFVLTR